MKGLIAAQVTMSSREIADLTEKRHDNVKRTIEALQAMCIVQPQSEDEQAPDDLGRLRTSRIYLLSKRDTLVVVARLSPEFTAKVIDRWQELEGQSPRLPQNFAEALRLAADQAEQIEQQREQLAIAAPKVDFVDRYVESSGSKGFRQVAKLLKANEARFREFMADNRIMYRLGGEWVPFQCHLDAGRFEVKAGSSDGGHAFNQSKFTPKGINWIAGLWGQHMVGVGGEV